MTPDENNETVTYKNAAIGLDEAYIYEDGKYRRDGEVTPEGKFVDDAIDLIKKWAEDAKESCQHGEYSQAKLYLEAANNTIYYAARQCARWAAVDD